MKKSKNYLIMIGALIIVLISGCTPYTQSGFTGNQFLVRNQDEAGSVHTTVVNVVEWDKVKEDLEANFPMDETIAINDSIPTTLYEQQQLIDAMKLTLKLALPTATFEESDEESVSSSSSTTETTTDGKVTSTATDTTSSSSSSTESESKKSGDIESVPDSDSLAGDSPASLKEPLSGIIDKDPLLVRKNAISLLQSVRLLNRSIEDAVTRTNHKAFVVTLQHTLMPYARQQPLDAFATTIFFTPTSVDGSAKPYPTSLKSMKPDGSVSNQVNNQVDCKKSIRFGNPVVVPLLATDNLEASSQNRSSNFIRQFGLGVSAVVEGVNGQFSVDRFKQNVESIAGEDLNSIVTVGSISENAVRVRFGAMNQGSTRYAMVPRNYNIHLLVLVPECHAIKEKAMLQIMNRTGFKNAQTGEELASRSQRDVRRKLKEAINSLELDRDTRGKVREQQETLLNHMLADEYHEFVDLVTELNIAEKAQPLWLELTEIRLGSKYSGTVFQLPRPKGSPPAPEFYSQSVLLYDNGVQGKTKIFGNNLGGSRFHSSFKYGDLKIVSSSAEVSSGKDHISITYPSLQPLGMETPDQNMVKSFSVVCAPQQCGGEAPNFEKIHVVFKKTPVVSKINVRVPSTHIVADKDSQGRVGIIIEGTGKKEGPHFVRVKGADASPDSSTKKVVVRNESGQLEIKSDGLALLNLTNLSPGQTVELRVYDGTGTTQSTHTRFVVRATLAKK